MMAERHYDEEALVALMESELAGSDAHLPSCRHCSEKLEEFRRIRGVLHESAMWDRTAISAEPVPATLATLRAFAGRMKTEDGDAECMLSELLSGDREGWLANLRRHPHYRTTGVVRKLITAASKAVDTMPPDAVAMTTLATEIADGLDPEQYPGDTVRRLRGAAWRERAYALYYTGMFTDSLHAVERADEEFAQLSVGEYEQARLGIVRSLIYRAFERLDEAARVAAESAEVFERHGDLNRLVSARMVEVQVLFSRGDFKAAEPILGNLDRDFADALEADTHARVLNNRGYCARMLGRVPDAVAFYELATGLFEALGNQTEAVRNRWNVAMMLAQSGRLTDAYQQLVRLSPEMERLGMTSEAAVHALDIADLLLAEERFEDVEQLCRSAMQSFERAGVAYSAPALMALALIREAASRRSASRELVRSVREYIRRLPQEPNLLFAPPPE